MGRVKFSCRQSNLASQDGWVKTRGRGDAGTRGRGDTDRKAHFSVSPRLRVLGVPAQSGAASRGCRRGSKHLAHLLQDRSNLDAG